MDNSRFWLLTNTTYGTWLPGDARGSVTSVRAQEVSGPRVEHDIPGTPYEEHMPALVRSAQEHLKCPPIYLNREQAETLLHQFLETAEHRGWILHAVAIMANHFHMVVEVLDDPPPRKILGDFKAYGSRSLNDAFGRPTSGAWWTDKGSKRKLKDELAVHSAIEYLMGQEFPLVLWRRGEGGEPRLGAQR